MNSTLQLWIESHLCPWLGDIAWQGTAILAFTLLVGRCVKRRSAAVRHSLLVLGISGVALLTMLSTVMPTWSMRRGSTANTPQRASLALSDATITGRSEETKSANPSTQHRAKQEAPSQAPPTAPRSITPPSTGSTRITLPIIATGIWAAGIISGSVLLAMSMLRLRRLRLRAEPATHATLQAALRRACEDAGLAMRSVQLLLADRGAMPAMWGWRRITVLLPRDAEDWTRERLDFVLRHELAHAARGDAALSLGCWIVLLPFWWHPLAWLSLRQLSRLREEACDERVLSGLRPTQHTTYAETLVQIIAATHPATHRAWLPALAMASTQARKLRIRLEAIVDEHRDRRPLTHGGRACVLFFTALLATGLSMLSACRETPKPATGTTNEDGSRTYFLTDRQWTTLTKLPQDERPAPPPPPADPFAPAGSAPAVTSPHAVPAESLAKQALRIRTYLLAEGAEFSTAPEDDVVVLKNERTMRVWADDANHGKVTKILQRAGQKTMVRIVCHAFAVPLDSAWIKSLTTLAPTPPNTLPSYQPSLSARLPEAEAAALIEKIRADKSCTLFATPTVVTADNQRATLEIIREFIYPTEFDPPQVPNNLAPRPNEASGPTIVPITPTTPTAFEMRPVGLRVEVDPTVEPGGSITLALSPEWTVFEGFVNYGQPIYASSTDASGKVTPIEVSPNKIQQPLFRTNKVQTSATLHNGDYLVLGGFGEPPGADLANPQNSVDLAARELTRGADGNMTLSQLPPMSKVDRAIFFLFQAKIVE